MSLLCSQMNRSSGFALKYFWVATSVSGPRYPRSQNVGTTCSDGSRSFGYSSLSGVGFSRFWIFSIHVSAVAHIVVFFVPGLAA